MDDKNNPYRSLEGESDVEAKPRRKSSAGILGFVIWIWALVLIPLVVTAQVNPPVLAVGFVSVSGALAVAAFVMGKGRISALTGIAIILIVFLGVLLFRLPADSSEYRRKFRDWSERQELERQQEKQGP